MLQTGFSGSRCGPSALTHSPPPFIAFVGVVSTSDVASLNGAALARSRNVRFSIGASPFPDSSSCAQQTLASTVHHLGWMFEKPPSAYESGRCASKIALAEAEARAPMFLFRSLRSVILPPCMLTNSRPPRLRSSPQNHCPARRRRSLAASSSPQNRHAPNDPQAAWRRSRP
jgi:hypothetical protein